MGGKPPRLVKTILPITSLYSTIKGLRQRSRYPIARANPHWLMATVWMRAGLAECLHVCEVEDLARCLEAERDDAMTGQLSSTVACNSARTCLEIKVLPVLFIRTPLVKMATATILAKRWGCPELTRHKSRGRHWSYYYHSDHSRITRGLVKA